MHFNKCTWLLFNTAHILNDLIFRLFSLPLPLPVSNMRKTVSVTRGACPYYFKFLHISAKHTNPNHKTDDTKQRERIGGKCKQGGEEKLEEAE